MEWQNFNSGDVIFQEGEQSDAAYLIISGDVRIIQRYDTEEPKQLAVVGAGEYVGEMGAVDSQPRSASAIADGTVVCARVTPEEFMPFPCWPSDRVVIRSHSLSEERS